MAKKRTGEPWMPAAAFGRSLPRGVGLNLLVAEVAPMAAFWRDVLGAGIVYADADFCALECLGSVVLLHADHSYLDHPMHGIAAVEARGAGLEVRLYGLDPDAAEVRARAAGADILAGAADKPHGLRECHILGPHGYVFVPSLPSGGNEPGETRS